MIMRHLIYKLFIQIKYVIKVATFRKGFLQQTLIISKVVIFKPNRIY